jgi:hypothetical protein
MLSSSPASAKSKSMERRASPTLCGHFIELGLYSLIVDFVADISGAAFTGLALLDNNPDFL